MAFSILFAHSNARVYTNASVYPPYLRAVTSRLTKAAYLLSLVSVVICYFLLVSTPTVASPITSSQPLPSLQAYTGIWNMPNARVLPDWHMRLLYGQNDPYSYYGGALGIWDRLEIHGQFTAVDTIEAFEGEGYGDYKDRSAGARLVLLKEDDWCPQIAGGFFDVTGTGLFGSRYIVASKMIGDVDVTVGLGQGILAGEFVGGETSAVTGDSGDAGLDFLFSSPARKTRPFAGLEYHVTPHLTLSAEYSSINYDRMFGYVASDGSTKVKTDNSNIPINLGLKYKLTPNIHLNAAYMRGNELGIGGSLEFPLDPEGMLGWKKKPDFQPLERTKWEAFEGNNTQLAEIVCSALKDDGFTQVAVTASDTALWIEAHNAAYLSQGRALGRLASIVDRLAPERISVLYFNLIEKEYVISSLRTTRADLRAFLESRLDKGTFLAVGDLTMFADDHWETFSKDATCGKTSTSNDDWYDVSIYPKVRTFLNNRKGFFKHKVVIQNRGKLYPWKGGMFAGELEFTLYNEYDELAYDPLEDDATRTDLVLYEEKSSPRMTQLAFDQIVELPGNILTRGAVGAFESAYAGFGAECFRFFSDGRLGVGLESQWVRKRDIDDNFALRNDLDNWFHTAFLNVYANVWPEQGLEMGLKLGRFLAGDKGVELEVRRSFKYFTLGARYTKTDTDIFSSDKNRGTDQKAVFIRIPFSVFKDHEVKGTYTYEITSFTRDPGATVRQPRSLFPMNPWSTTDDLKRTLEEMRE